MIRVLVFGMTSNPGGVESFLINYYRHIDRNKIQFDFLCNSHEPIAYEEEVIGLGARTFHIAARSQNMVRYKKELKKVFDQHANEWDAIWVNISSLANIDYLKIAKKYGIERRIIHSHNSDNMDSKIRGILHKWNRLWIGSYATDFWACSMDAAQWFYKEKLIKKAVVIHNAIDVMRLTYDEQKRKQIRSRLGIGNEYVVGNIGRLHFQKNQTFVIDVFNEFTKKCPESRLVFVGQGEDEKMLKKKSETLGLTGKVIFVGVQRDIEAWLSAFDIFLFPSLFEGLGIAALEAQANGLPVLASSEVIPQEVKINENFVFYNLSHSACKWAEQLLELKMNTSRMSVDELFQSFVSNGYEIGAEIDKLEKLLLK